MFGKQIVSLCARGFRGGLENLSALRTGNLAAFSRSFATIDDLKSEIEAINDKFSEARDEIDMAREDEGTTYFAEGYDLAKKATDECLDLWHSALQKLDQSEKEKLQRSMGLKMEQLKAEFKILQDILEDDH